jgi:two-component system, NtrC family, sensor kinase
MATPLAPSPQAQSSLARSTLIKMGVRIAVIIALTTFVSYFHIFSSFRDETLARMERNVSERSQREQAIFILAEDNLATLKKALEERVQSLRQEDPGPRFDSLFVQLPDGSIRNRTEGFNPARMPCAFIPKGGRVDTETRRWLVAAHDVLAQYGPAFHVRFQDTYITLPGGAMALYWPESPTWCKDAEAEMPISSFPFFTVSTPENNPQRQTAWTGIFVDPVADAWMVSASIPVDVDGRHVATISHDILINQLMARTVDEHLPHAYNMLFRDDGQLIAHPELKTQGAAEAYNILSAAGDPGLPVAQLGSEEQQEHVRRIFGKVKSQASGKAVLELPEHGEYIATARLRGPGWTFVTVLPEQVVSAAAFQVARYVLVFGVVSLLLELAIMFWVLRQQISRPLLSFTQATGRLAAGDFKVELDTTRRDELGQLAHSFQHMAGELQRREEALRQANEGLEQRVEQRTQELKEVHRQLVETARQVGRAEIATNVLHNVGNVLNSVYTSALVAQERLGKLKIESVERVAALLEEHRGELSTFLTEDKQGRNALPFLSRLGKHMLAERQELQTLLGDVSRHTEHIGAIVKLQQQYARVPQQMYEPVQLGELVEDALRINQAALGRHSVRVERHLEELPPVETEKHKVLMILVNLISNAKYAVASLPEEERLLTVTVGRSAAGRFIIEVRDNGMGIAPEMLTRIFQYGFTTREEGHGFGLHSSALAAQELGGSLTAHSDGPGQGAAFTLELPATPEKQRERAHA